MIRLRILGLLAATAILYFFSFPPFLTGYLAYCFLIPFFALLRMSLFKRGFRYGVAAGCLSISATLHWLALNAGTSTLQGSAMLVTTTLYLSIAWGIFGAVLAFVCRRMGERGLFAAPFLWTAMEYVQSLGELGFTWHSVATTHTYFLPLIQFVSGTGMFGISFLVVSMNVLLYYAWLSFATPLKKERTVRTYLPLIVAAGMIGMALTHGVVALLDDDPHLTKGPRVAVVQPNVDVNQKWAERNAAYMDLVKLSLTLDKHATDLIIWPETAVPFRVKERPVRLNTIKDMVRKRGVPLLGGFLGRRSVEKHQVSGDVSDSRSDAVKRRGFRNLNSVYLFQPDRHEIEAYDKLHLVPFGEYTPSILWFLEPMMLDVGTAAYVSGNYPHVFDIAIDGPKALTLKTAALVCLESTYASLVSRFVDEGAEMLVVVANDGWYDGTFQKEQHAQIAVLRAIEHRIPVVRSANTGISSIIDPYGRTVAATENREQTILKGTVPLRAKRSAYSKYGDWFPFGALITSLLIIVLAVSWRRLRRRELSD